MSELDYKSVHQYKIALDTAGLEISRLRQDLAASESSRLALHAQITDKYVPALQAADRMANEQAARADRVQAALERAAGWFDTYALQHAGKATAEGDAKARTNADRAAECRAALQTGDRT